MSDFENIEEYIKKSKEERQSHIDKLSPCIRIGGDSRDYRGLLAHFVKTTIPKGSLIHCCHSCFVGDCSNPKHLYWGTVKENVFDTKIAGKRPKPSSNFTHKGHKHSDEQKKKWSIERKGNKAPCANTRYVTNGLIDKRLKFSQEIPEGFWLGRSNYKKR